jgi:hypothetical protein
MKKIVNGLLLLSVVALTTSCNKQINELQANPNNATSVTADLILGTVLKEMSGTGDNGNLGGINSWDNAHKFNQYHIGAYGYYGDNQYDWQSGSFNSYLALKNVVKMEEEAAGKGMAAVNPYESIGKFVRAYYYYNLTSMMGDIPLEEALLGKENAKPAYQTQKEVFRYVLSILDTANTHLSELVKSGDNAIASSVQDIYFNGDLAKWQKAVNSFKLRVLISLSNTTGASDLKLAEQFAAIVGNASKYPVFTSQADDLKFTYVATYNQYSLHRDNFGSTASRYGMAETYVKSLTDIKDPRVFVTCEPAWGLAEAAGYSATDFRAFVGESTGQSIDKIEAEASARLFSFINRKRYYSTYVGEPDVLVGYKELCFNIAEAINRGWITGDAEAWYKKGITESMAFYGIDVAATGFTAYFLKSGGLNDIATYPISFNFNDYYAQSAVKYAGGSEGLKQIVLQKYIALFQNSGWEGYFNYRRTGVPTFKNGTGIGNNGTIPKRWGYPSSEQNRNGENWKAALSNQGFSSDDINAKMWLIK